MYIYNPRLIYKITPSGSGEGLHYSEGAQRRCLEQGSGGAVEGLWYWWGTRGLELPMEMGVYPGYYA